MNITIFGQGAVGAAMGHALSIRKGHHIAFIDPPKGVLGSVDDADLILICVPTPFSKNWTIGFDPGALTAALNNCPAGSRVLIKSTVPPGTTEHFQHSYPDLDLFFSPEFLTEKTSFQDAMYPARQIVGYAGPGDCHRAAMAHFILSVLPDAPWEYVTLSTEAELIKYFSNAFYAVKVTFANQMYDLCEALKEQGVDYDDVREAAEHDPMINPNHLDVHHKGYRGFGGKCLPKDLSTLIHTMQRLGLAQDYNLMVAARDYNDDMQRIREMHEPLIRIAGKS